MRAQQLTAHWNSLSFFFLTVELLMYTAIAGIVLLVGIPFLALLYSGLILLFWCSKNRPKSRNYTYACLGSGNWSYRIRSPENIGRFF